MFKIRFLAVLICLFMVSLLYAQMPVQASNFEELKAAVEAPGDSSIVITKNIDLTGTINAVPETSKSIYSVMRNQISVSAGNGFNMNNTSLNFTNINFSNSLNANGIFNLSNNANLIFQPAAMPNLNFDTNKSQNSLFNAKSNSIITFNTQSTFSNNITENANGGSIFNLNSGAMLIFNAATSFKDNINASLNKGGAIYLTNSQVLFNNNALFQNNISTGSSGGGFYADENFTVEFKKDIIFEQNQAINGGGFYALGDAFDDIVIFVSTAAFTRNSAVENGGAFYSDGSITEFNNKATFEENISGKDGGAFFATVSYADFFCNAYFNRNEAGRSGGAIRVNNGTKTEFHKRASFTENKAAQNDPEGKGGAIYASNLSFLKFYEGAEFIGNEAAYGGAIAMDGDLAIGYPEYFATSLEMSFDKNSVFENNKASKKGGAIYMKGVSQDALARILFVTEDLGGGNNKTIFQGNTANGKSNAMYLDEFSEVVFSIFQNSSVEMYDSIDSVENTKIHIYGLNSDFNLYSDSNINNLYIDAANLNLKGGVKLTVSDMEIIGHPPTYIGSLNMNDSRENMLIAKNFSLDGALKILGNDDGNVIADNVLFGTNSSLDIMTDLENKNYWRKYYKVIKYNNSVGGTIQNITLNDGMDLSLFANDSSFEYVDNWIIFKMYGDFPGTSLKAIKGLSYNQRNVASNIDLLTASGNMSEEFERVISNLDTLSTENVKKDALSDISGYFLANVLRSAINIKNENAVYDRIKYNAPYGENTNGIWAQAIGAYSEISSNENSPEKYQDTGTGFMAGWDKVFDDQGILVGLFGQYTMHDIKQNENKADIKRMGAGIYGGLLRDEWEMKVSISGDSNSFNVERKIDFIDQRSKSEFDAFGIAFDIEGALRNYINEQVCLKPYIGINIKNLKYDDFYETGVGELSLNVTGDEYMRNTMRFGIAIADDESEGPFEWYGGLEYSYLFSGDEPEIKMSFRNSQDIFNSKGGQELKSILGFGGGISYKIIDAMKVYANVNLKISEKHNDVYGNIGLRYMFL